MEPISAFFETMIAGIRTGRLVPAARIERGEFGGHIPRTIEDAKRKATVVNVHWQFTTANARVKLKRLYPTFQLQ